MRDDLGGDPPCWLDQIEDHRDEVVDSPEAATPTPTPTTNGALAIGVLRAAVGVAMIAAPRAVARPKDGVDAAGDLVFMVRTIGVRDLALGLGTVATARSGRATEARRWVRFGLASDALDVVVGSVAGPLLGRRGAAAAALIPLPFVAADAWILRSTLVDEGAPAALDQGAPR